MKECYYKNVEEVLEGAIKLIEAVEEYQLDEISYSASAEYPCTNYTVYINGMYGRFSIDITEDGSSITDNYEYNTKTKKLSFLNTCGY